jgi:hypothetical protein
LDQFIKHPAILIGRIEQQARISDHLLRTHTLHIHRATCQVITPLRTSALPIHLLTPIPARNYDGDFPS